MLPEFNKPDGQNILGGASEAPRCFFLARLESASPLENVTAPPSDGAYIFGLYLEGARWDLAAGSVEDAYMKELYPKMPVILVRSILAEKEDTRGIYRCPVYKQTERATPGFDTPGSGFVFMMQLKTKQPASKWVMAGCAMLLATD